MAIQAAHLRVDIDADTSGLEAGARRTDGIMGGLGGKVAAFGAAAVAAGGAAAAAFGVKAVMAAASLNETISKVGVVFGDQSRVVTDYANKMAKDFGTPKGEILNAAASIGLIGKASGLSQKDAAKMSTSLAQMAVDASSFYDVPVAEALEKINSGLVGETEPMRAFGVLLSQNAVDAEIMALGLNKVTGMTEEQMKTQARASLIMKGMSDASGDLERTQDSLSNRIRELKGRATNFAADVGTKLIPVVLKVLDVMERWAPIIRDRLVGAFQALQARVAPFTALIQRMMPHVQALAERIGPQLVPILTAMGGAFAAMKIAGLVTSMIGLVTAFGGAAAAAGGLVPLLAGLFPPFTLLAVAVGALVLAWHKFPVVREIVANVVGFIQGAFGGLIEYVQRMWPQISEAIDHVLTVVKTVIGVFVDFVLALWRAWGDNLMDMLMSAWDFIRDTIDNALKFIRGLIQTVLAVINGDWGKAWDGIKGMLGAVWDQIRNIVSTAIDFVKEIIGGGLSTIQQLWQGVWDHVKGFLGGIWDGIKRTVSEGVSATIGFFVGLPGKIVGAIGDLAGALVNLAQAAWDAWDKAVDTAIRETIQFISELPGRIVKGLGNIGDTLLNAGKDLIGGFIRGIQNMAPKIIGAIKDAITDKLPGFVKKALGIGSPSKVFMELGMNVGEGMALGIQQSGKLVDRAMGGLVNVPSMPAAGYSALGGRTGAGGITVAPVYQIDARGAEAGTGDRIREILEQHDRELLAMLRSR